MNLVDLLIVLLLVLGIFRGLRTGLARQGLALAGFFGGLFVGSILARHLAGYGHDALMRFVIVGAATLGLASIFSTIGEVIGLRLRIALDKRRLSVYDEVLGGVLEVASVLITVWLLASILTSLPLYRINAVVRASSIVRALEAHLPPAPSIIAGLEHIIDPNGFPKVFIGREPVVGPTNPGAPADVQQALARDGASTVRIEGLGCGGVVEGSGFVAAPGFVATNAHVVAGVRQQTVEDRRGTHNATVVWFDPDLDFAVLRVGGVLAGAPLPISGETYGPNTPAVVLGYPGGGPLHAESAVVARTAIAVGRNIYNEGITSRSIYYLETDIEPGNSGGPLVLSDGTVIGVVFARSVDNPDIGYALTTGKVISELNQATSRNAQVSTGTCASD